MQVPPHMNDRNLREPSRYHQESECVWTQGIPFECVPGGVFSCRKFSLSCLSFKPTVEILIWFPEHLSPAVCDLNDSQSRVQSVGQGHSQHLRLLCGKQSNSSRCKLSCPKCGWEVLLVLLGMSSYDSQNGLVPLRGFQGSFLQQAKWPLLTKNNYIQILVHFIVFGFRMWVQESSEWKVQ